MPYHTSWVYRLIHVCTITYIVTAVRVFILLAEINDVNGQNLHDMLHIQISTMRSTRLVRVCAYMSVGLILLFYPEFCAKIQRIPLQNSNDL